MRPLQDKLNDEEAGVALLQLARMLKDVDTLMSSSVWRLPEDIQQKVQQTFAVDGLSPDRLSDQIRQIAVELMDSSLARKREQAPMQSALQRDDREHAAMQSAIQYDDPSDPTAPSL